jgi:hypothetical protein
MNRDCEGCKHECEALCHAIIPPVPCWEAWLSVDDSDICVMYEETE